ncbi:MAG: phasin family protein [Novosphingobium sp.]
MAEAQDTQPLDTAEKAYAEAAAEAPVVLPALKPAKVESSEKTNSKPKPAARKAPVKKPSADSGEPTLTVLKEKIMAKTTNDITSAFTSAFADLKEKAKSAYEKGTATAGEATEFAKGNVEAIVESGKILAEGAKALGGELVAESKTAFETMTADVKEMAAVKSPADFFKFQSELMRRNFDAAVAAGSKNTEAMFKLTNDAFAPISSRVSLAVEKFSKAA